jgi:hypothetical protein
MPACHCSKVPGTLHFSTLFEADFSKRLVSNAPIRFRGRILFCSDVNDLSETVDHVVLPENEHDEFDPQPAAENLRVPVPPPAAFKILLSSLQQVTLFLKRILLLTVPVTQSFAQLFCWLVVF